MKIIGISGGSGSGKTYFSLKLLKKFEKKIGIFKLDSYYKDLSDMNLIDRKENNFDHPDSFDFNLFKTPVPIRPTPIMPIVTFSSHLPKKRCHIPLSICELAT